MKRRAFLDVGHKPTVEILAIQDVNLVLALCQQTGDVGLREEMTHVTGEEEDTRISEEQFVAPLCSDCLPRLSGT